MKCLVSIMLALLMPALVAANEVTLKASKNPTTLGESTGFALEVKGMFSSIFDGNEYCSWKISSSDGSINREYKRSDYPNQVHIVHWASFFKPGKVRIEAQPASLGCEYQHNALLDLTVLEDYTALDLHIIGTPDTGHRGPVKAVILETAALKNIGAGLDPLFRQYLPVLLQSAIKLDPRGAQIKEVVFRDGSGDAPNFWPDAETVYIVTRDLMEILEIEWDKDGTSRYKDRDIRLIERYGFSRLKDVIAGISSERNKQFMAIDAAWRGESGKFAVASVLDAAQNGNNWCRIEARRDKPWMETYVESAAFRQAVSGLRMNQMRVLNIANGEAPLVRREDGCQVIIGRAPDLLRTMKYWHEQGYEIRMGELQGEEALMPARAKREGFASVDDMRLAWTLPDGYSVSDMARLHALGISSAAALDGAVARLRSKNYSKEVHSSDLLRFLEDERDGAKAGMSATAWRDKRIKETQLAQAAAAREYAKKYPYRAEFECRYGEVRLPMVNCMVEGRGGYVEITQGSEQKLYGWQEFQNRERFDLQAAFRLRIQNPGSEFMIRVLIKDNASNALKAERFVRPRSVLLLTP